MGSISRKCFSQKAASKTKYEAKANQTYQQRHAFCRICGKPTAGKKWCQACMESMKKKKGGD